MDKIRTVFYEVEDTRHNGTFYGKVRELKNGKVTHTWTYGPFDTRENAIVWMNEQITTYHTDVEIMPHLKLNRPVK